MPATEAMSHRAVLLALRIEEGEQRQRGRPEQNLRLEHRPHGHDESRGPPPSAERRQRRPQEERQQPGVPLRAAVPEDQHSRMEPHHGGREQALPGASSHFTHQHGREKCRGQLGERVHEERGEVEPVGVTPAVDARVLPVGPGGPGGHHGQAPRRCSPSPCISAPGARGSPVPGARTAARALPAWPSVPTGNLGPRRRRCGSAEWLPTRHSGGPAPSPPGPGPRATAVGSQGFGPPRERPAPGGRRGPGSGPVRRLRSSTNEDKIPRVHDEAEGLPEDEDRVSASRRDGVGEEDGALPPRLRYQNEMGTTLSRFRSEAIHWTRNRAAKSACPRNPIASHALLIFRPRSPGDGWRYQRIASRSRKVRTARLRRPYLVTTRSSRPVVDRELEHATSLPHQEGAEEPVDAVEPRQVAQVLPTHGLERAAHVGEAVAGDGAPHRVRDAGGRHDAPAGRVARGARRGRRRYPARLWSISGMSAGLFWRSASRVTTISPRAVSNPARKAADCPALRRRRTTRRSA